MESFPNFYINYVVKQIRLLLIINFKSIIKVWYMFIKSYKWNSLVVVFYQKSLFKPSDEYISLGFV